MDVDKTVEGQHGEGGIGSHENYSTGIGPVLVTSRVKSDSQGLGTLKLYCQDGSPLRKA